jgi:hypothetical protein
LDDFALGGGHVAELLVGDFPRVGDGAAAIQKGDEPVGGFVESEKLIAGRVLKDVPHVAAELLPMHLHAGEQMRFQLGDAIPRFTECRAIDWQGKLFSARK